MVYLDRLSDLLTIFVPDGFTDLHALLRKLPEREVLIRHWREGGHSLHAIWLEGESQSKRDNERPEKPD